MHHDDLPEHYIDEDGNRTARPAYRMLGQCYLVIADNGQVGPTLMEAGSDLIDDGVPGHQWEPLNKAAAVRKQQWIDSLPLEGKNIAQEHINEAAYTLRPREGDPEFPIEQWWPAVLRLAAKIADKGRVRTAQAAPGYRPVRPDAPPMPFASTSSAYPTEAGRPPPSYVAQPNPNAAMRTRAKPQPPNKAAMPGANVTSSPGQATG